MKIQANRLERMYEQHQDEYEQAALRVLRSGWYVLGEEGKKFENAFARAIDRMYCVGLNSGLDALVLAFRALEIGRGDEVIVPANTYIASVLSITANGATPVFVEPDEYYCIDADKIEVAITNKTKAILVVHLYGQACDMSKICHIAKTYNLKLIEDCAQSHLACFENKKTGTFGDIGCFSFFPTKNFGAFGDSGAVVTNNEKLAQRIYCLRNYGSSVKYINDVEGINSRMDELQAALLFTKLPYLFSIIEERAGIANKYLNGITNSLITLPKTRPKCNHTWHLFVISTPKRDRLKEYLATKEIETQIHYPIPPHLQMCYNWLGYSTGDYPIAEKQAETILSLPLYNGMTDEEVRYVITVINDYRG